MEISTLFDSSLPLVIVFTRIHNHRQYCQFVGKNVSPDFKLLYT